MTEPPAGTEAGGSCTAAAALPELSITEPEPPAEMERTAEGTSTSPALEICTAREILCPTDVRDCAGVPVIESAGGRRAAPDDADADCAAKVRPESALAPERLTVSCTAVPAVCGTTVSVCVELVPAAMASCTSEGVTLPPVAETLSCAPERSTSPSLRAWTVTATGRPTSTTPGNAREASAGAGPLRTVSARRTESAAGASPRAARAVASSCSHPGPAAIPCTRPSRGRARPAGSTAPERETFAASAAPPPALTLTVTCPRSTQAGASSCAVMAC